VLEHKGLFVNRLGAVDLEPLTTVFTEIFDFTPADTFANGVQTTTSFAFRIFLDTEI
jgi:hypothetical protein